MRDSIVAAHRTLDGLFESTRRSLDAGLGASAIDAFCRLREALEAHFEKEDRLYLPPIAALRPDARRVVEELAASHEAFRARFGEIGGLLERGCFEEASRVFNQFAETFAIHEATEEQLLAELDRDVLAAS